MTEKNKTLSASIPEEFAGKRLDQTLAGMFHDYSRSQFQEWIRQGRVHLNDLPPRQRDRVAGGERVTVRVPEAREEPWEAQPIPLDIVYEDEAILVLNKPAGLVVHPGAGNRAGTLLNALLNHAPELRALARAGIVHRLDKDTSGLLAVAKTDRARLNLIAQLRERTLMREYLAIVTGVMVAGGAVEAPIGRHPRERTRMAVNARGKPAVSHYRVVLKFRAHTLLRVRLESGRTHQIRVHMAHLRHPVVGDPVYGGRLGLPAGCSEELARTLRACKRQALHAAALGLIHPVSGKKMEWTADLPDDMKNLLAILKEDARREGK